MLVFRLPIFLLRYMNTRSHRQGPLFRVMGIPSGFCRNGHVGSGGPPRHNDQFFDNLPWDSLPLTIMPLLNRSKIRNLDTMPPLAYFLVA